MAKQYGLHKLGGKVDGQSYYYSKNGGFVSRKVNPGMSERVKTGKEYANTRKNNSEFGAAGALAGAIISPISLRWRFILDPISTGKMVKEIKKLMNNDTEHGWGQRLIPDADFVVIQDKFNSFSKNEIPMEILSTLKDNLQYNSTTKNVITGDGATFTTDTVEQLREQGVDGVISRIFGMRVTAPTLTDDGSGYEEPKIDLVELDVMESNVNLNLEDPGRIIADDSAPLNFSIINDGSHIAGLLVVLLPYKNVGNSSYTLQELCSACWVTAKEYVQP